MTKFYEIWTCKDREIGIVPRMTPNPFNAGRAIEQLHQNHPEYEIWLRTWVYDQPNDEFVIETNEQIY